MSTSKEKKFPGKVIALTFQTNIKFHMFRNELVMKKIKIKRFLTSTGVLFSVFYPEKTPETNGLMTIPSGEENTIIFIAVNALYG